MHVSGRYMSSPPDLCAVPPYVDDYTLDLLMTVEEMNLIADLKGSLKGEGGGSNKGDPFAVQEKK